MTSDLRVRTAASASEPGLSTTALDAGSAETDPVETARGGGPGPFSSSDFEPHGCFACGELNEHGLHLQLHVDERGAWTELELDARFQGWDEVAHGGIVCTILDEVMAWSVIGRGTWGVTARMSVAFRRPVRTGSRIRAEGTVAEHRRRLLRTTGRIVDAASGELLATSEAVFVAAPPERLASLQARYRLRGTRRS